MAMKMISMLVFLCVVNLAAAQLKVGFYNVSCPKAESIIKTVIKSRFKRDVSITAALLRLSFHDCFVRGCDASILIDSTPSATSEKAAGPNLSVRGYDIIDDAKTKLEEACPSTVSCADIITIATRDAVALSGGPSYSVTTGRRDGFFSNIFDVDLPAPEISVSDALKLFTAKKLTIGDMVTLLGAHTVGITHCSIFSDRLTNFRGSGKPDRSMNTTLVAILKKTCASKSKNNRVNLDQGTQSIVDNSFYKQILIGKGILEVDQNLARDGLSNRIVKRFASDGNVFKQTFANSLIRLSNVEVLVGNAGEIRKNCRVVNPRF